MCDDGKVAGSVPSWKGAFMFCVLVEQGNQNPRGLGSYWDNGKAK